MNVLCIGDVVGDVGMDFLAAHLSAVKREHQIDLCIVNGENSDKSGTGLTRHGAEFLRSIGADVITTGNHCYRRTDPAFFSETDYALCPANQPFQELCCGVYEVDMGRYTACVINLAGVAFLEPLDSPFSRLDEILAQTSARFVIVDFHAESTAEKAAFAYYADGRVSAVFGTHTHVPTADAQVLPQGTGFITDVGMTGPINSVIGVVPALAIQRQRLHIPTRFEVAAGPCRLDGVVFSLDDKTGKCVQAKRVFCAD